MKHDLFWRVKELPKSSLIEMHKLLKDEKESAPDKNLHMMTEAIVCDELERRGIHFEGARWVGKIVQVHEQTKSIDSELFAFPGERYLVNRVNRANADAPRILCIEPVPDHIRDWSPSIHYDVACTLYVPEDAVILAP